MKAIAEGIKESQEVLAEQLKSMQDMLASTVGKKDDFKSFFHERF